MTPSRGPLPVPGAHGGDGPAVARALGLDPASVLDLSASLNPAAPDPAPLVTGHIGSIRHYPDPAAATAALAAVLGVEPERILLTNGGAEAIALVAAEVGEGAVEEPEFSLYRRHLRRLRAGAGRWRSDPHNPSGVLAGPAERAAVWDEAFYPLATGRWTSGRADEGAVVVGSLTKLFACPGLRMGYVLAPPGSTGHDLIGRLAEAQPRWSVGSLVCAVLPELLATAEPVAWAHEVARLRGELVALLREAGLSVTPGAANWVLATGRVDLRAELATQGVLVRDCASFGLPTTVRVAVPDDAGRHRLGAALARVRS